MPARASVVLALAAGVLQSAARSSAPPLEKAIGLLEDVQAKVEAEGEDEAKTYNTFACFCKDTQAAKSSSIDAATIQKDELQASMNEAATARDEADTETQTTIADLGAAEAEIEKLTSERHANALEYEKNEIDLTGAIQALTSAINELKAVQSGSASSLLQTLKSSRHFGMVRRSLLMAEVLSDKVAKKAATALAALQVDGEASEIPTGDLPTETYSFHSGDIIQTLEDLKTEFKTQKDTLDKDEVDSKQTYHQAIQDQEKIIEEKQTRLTELKELKAEKTTAIAQASQDVTAVAAQVLDDQKYLQEVSNACAEKAQLWDQRTKLRSNELGALTQATTILNSLMAEDSAEALVQTRTAHEKKSVSFLQAARMKHPSDLALRAMRSKIVKRASYVHAHEQQEETHDVAQVKQAASSGSQGNQKLRASAGAKASKVAALLKSEGKKLKSQELMYLAAKVTEDPFAKVKQLIQDLIERLLKEASEEANHKGWCDGELATATAARDSGAAEIAKANARMAKGEARRAKLAELVSTVDAEIEEVRSALNHTEVMRGEEKVQNEATVAEAEKGRDAVNEAIRILSEYYGAAAKGVTTDGSAFVQLSNDTAIPDAGFDGEYTGAQSASGGVVGMLEVIVSDFERQMKDAQDAEKKGEQMLLEMQTTSGASIAEKEEVSKAHGKALTETESEYEADQSSLTSNQDRLDKALGELDALYKACFDGGESAEERKAKREEEMTALKQALCILDSKSGGAEC
eukprot:TRINITY_DN12175_c0_g2_i2.p1 TRINITY_DN12175_c0_g2~~TRINITY_DN12175_c0_g2_i2.p1  ORF type:complete len:750 (+),score=308.83 TRINITY_DN12175_c0_g2_i2:91-2340(+)